MRTEAEHVRHLFTLDDERMFTLDEMLRLKNAADMIDGVADLMERAETP